MPVDMNIILQTTRAVLAKYPATRPVVLAASQPSTTSRDVLVISSIHRKPFFGVDVRAGLLDMSPQMLRRTLATLEAKAWLQQVPFSRRTRGYIRYPNLTVAGLRAAQLDMPGEGTGSFLHRHCQSFLKSFIAQTRHVDATIEYRLNDKNVDVGYAQDDRRVAIEVGLHTAENELNNITKDLQAGFHEVHVLFRDAPMLHRVQQIAPLPKRGQILKLELITDYLEQNVAPTETEN